MTQWKTAFCASIRYELLLPGSTKILGEVAPIFNSNAGKAETESRG